METVVIQKMVAGKSAEQTMSRIKELWAQAKRNETEQVKASLELGHLFNQYKIQLPGLWSANLERLGISQRAISRLMRAAKKLAPRGTVSQRLAAKLPADRVKLETLSGLDLEIIETLANKYDLRELIVARSLIRSGNCKARSQTPRPNLRPGSMRSAVVGPTLSRRSSPNEKTER